ncbi:MAG: tetratricopeptide repeat protein [Magnetococcales bacterium]|nr:tetratricopeptide repeat protein [Magnetococcales bacterium]
MTNPNHALEQVVKLIKVGHLHQAKAIIQQILEVEPKHPGALYLLGVIANNLGENGLALIVLKEAVSIVPQWVELHNILGFVYHELGQLDDAINSFKSVIKLQPNNVMAHNNLGSMLKESGHRSEAITSFNLALSLDPENAEVLNNKGMTHQELGQLDESLACYRKALEFKPDFVQVHNNLGNTLQEMKRVDEAIDSYQTCIEQEPMIAEVHKNLASAYNSQGRWNEAVSSYRRALAIDPNFAAALGGLGNALKHLGRFDEAVQQFRQALEIDPSLDDIRHLLASVTGETTKKAPRQYVEKLFDGFAGNFEHHLVKTLDYNAPKHLRAVVNHCVGSQAFYQHAVDLGCGTGLLGKEFRDLIGVLVGIDLSKKMIRQAEKSGIYDRLLVGDIEETINGMDQKFELCMSADVFPYVGELGSIFKAVKGHLSTTGQFLFLTEYADGADYVLNTNGRYAHSEQYVQGLAEEYGFTVLHVEKVVFRFDQGKEVFGEVYLLE